MSNTCPAFWFIPSQQISERTTRRAMLGWAHLGLYIWIFYHLTVRFHYSTRNWDSAGLRRLRMKFRIRRGGRGERRLRLCWPMILKPHQRQMRDALRTMTTGSLARSRDRYSRFSTFPLFRYSIPGLVSFLERENSWSYLRGYACAYIQLSKLVLLQVTMSIKLGYLSVTVL